MIDKFESIGLGGVGVLVLGSVALALLNPPSADFSVPKADLKGSNKGIVKIVSAPDWHPGIFPVRIEKKGSEEWNVGTQKTAYQSVALDTAAALSKTFEQIGYDLDDIKAGDIAVPRLFLTSLPSDMAEIRQTEKRKSLFFKTVLPLVLQINDEIQQDRQRLLDLHSQQVRGEHLLAVDRLWLIVLAERYKLEPGNMTELLERVDIVPVSLALAQAAEESGWGTSRFSREGNAIFGEWTYSSQESLLPRHRDSGKLHRVRTFKNLSGSVRAYVHNLNTHRAYRKFRALRNEMRDSGTPLRGHQLSKTLIGYSERGLDYIRGLRKIIRSNKLDRLDNVKLIRSQTAAKPVI